MAVTLFLSAAACGIPFARTLDEGEPLHVARAFDEAIVANDEPGIRRLAAADFDLASQEVVRSFAARRRLGAAADANAGISALDASVVINLVGRKETVHVGLVEVREEVWRVSAYSLDEEGKPLEES